MQNHRFSFSVILSKLFLGGAVLLPTLLTAETLNLSQAVKQALANSEEAKMSQEKKLNAEARKQEAWSGAFPNVTGYGSAGRSQSPFPPFIPSMPDSNGKIPSKYMTMNSFTYGAQVNQSLYSFGRLGQTIKMAGIYDKSQEATLTRSLQELQIQTLDAYFGVVLAKAHWETLEASLQRQKKLVDYLQQNFKMGAGQRSLVLLAVSSTKALEPQRIRAERDYQAARMSFNRLIGQPIDAVSEMDTAASFAMQPITDINAEQGVSEALKNRADLKALHLQKDFLREASKFQNMLYLPSLGFQGKYGVLAYKTKDLFNKDNLDWQFGIGLNWQIFDGFGNSARAKQTLSDSRNLEYTESKALNMVRIEIASDLSEQNASDSALSAAIEGLQAATDARALLAEDFAAGKGQINDILTAETNLRDAEFGILFARYQRVRSIAALKLALGKDLF